MSLVLSAAPFDNENTYTQQIKKKGPSHNKTQKKMPAHKIVDQDKVNNVLQSIHNTSNDMDDDMEMGDFHPPAQPISSGVEKTLDVKENPNMKYPAGSSANAEENNDPQLDMHDVDSNYKSQNEVDEYYKQYVPNYHADMKNQMQKQNPHGDGNGVNRPYYSHYQPQHMPSVTGGSDSSVLLEKLNYMIHLLEEQQEEKSNSVAEEVILYSFLGIFVIFLVDSFTRVGKYKR